MESLPVGGVPICMRMTRKLLPRNKTKRELVYKIRMVIFTYFIYALFNMSRRPLAVVKSRIVGECSEDGKNTNATDNWCDEILHNYTTPQAALGLLDFLLMVSYGLCLYVSGVVADCFNPRYYLTAGCFFSGYIIALMGLTDYWDIQSLKFKATLMILFGAGQSTAWPVVLSSVTHWYGAVGKRRGMFYGFWNTHNYLGSVLGISLARIWVDKNFMWSFFVPGFILFAAGVLVFVEMVVDPKDLKQLDREYSTSSGTSISFDQMLGSEIPSWLSSETSITVYEALTLPGVVEYSICMFFSRMVGYTFLFWLPVLMKKTNVKTASLAAYYSLAYVLGGSIGGILAGIFVDLSKRTAIVCALFLGVSIPILLLGIVSDLGRDLRADFPLFLVMGLVVEAPYVIISTSVSADLGTHKLIKKNYRALSTVGGIIEGTGALGASIGTYLSGLILLDTKWQYIFYAMAAVQFVAILCLSRQVYKEIFRKRIKEDKMEEISSYLKLPALH